MKLITAILLNYRNAALSLSCVNSLLAEDIDCVVVWDNSEDEGVSAKELQVNNPDTKRVHIEVSESNLGFAAGVNRAIEVALHHLPETWLLVINNDAVLLPGALTRLRQALLENSEAKLVVPCIHQGGAILGKRYYQRLTGMLFEHETKGCFAYPSGCCFLVASERFQFPLFDERFFMYGEDCALGFRLSAPGEIFYLDKTLVSHEGSVSSRIGSRFYEESLVASHFLMASVLAKSRVQLCMYIAGRIMALSARAVIRASRYRSAVPLKALWNGTKIAFRKILLLPQRIQ